MPRLKQLSRSQAPPELLPFYDMVYGKGVETPGNFFSVYANNPRVLKAFSAFSTDNPESAKQIKIRPELRTLAMARAGYAVGSQLLYSQHMKGMRMAGVSEEKAQAISHWTVADCFSPLERAILALTDAMVLQAGRAHDKVFEILRTQLGDDEILELTYLINAMASYGISCKVLRLEYDDVPERIVEIPVPKTKRAQNHLDPSSWDK